jgi:hypothetical protein
VEPPPDAPRSLAFVIRIRLDRQAMRGQVVDVADGATRLFEDLADAVTFIRARVARREPQAGIAGE